jgi:LL-diaminopimelate aminotransferase
VKPATIRRKHINESFYSARGERIAALEAAGLKVIRLDVGSPDLPPAEHILAALQQSAASPHNHGYQEHLDSSRLKVAWADLYKNVFNLSLDPSSEILPLIGSKEGIFQLPLIWVDPGDVVLIPDPSYPTYTQGTQFAGGKPYYLPLLSERNFLPDLNSIPVEILRKARILWLNYPNNPTGAVAPIAFFHEAVAFAQQHGLLLCHDAAYHQVTFDGYRAPSILEIPGAKETAVEFNTLSKSYNMAGWRLGAVMGKPEVLKKLASLKSQSDSGHFRPIITAALAALKGDQGWLVERNRTYQERRDIALTKLRSMEFKVQATHASLYIWCPVPPGWTSSLEFTDAILENTGVSLTPGSVFGPSGEGWFRLSITASAADIDEGLDSIERWLACL